MVLALAGGWGAAALRPDTRPALTSALDALPADTRVVGFTDWARIREHLDLGRVDTRAERSRLTNLGASRDLTTRSVINRGLEEMNDALGWSAADVTWEAYGQGEVGAAAAVRLVGSVDFEDLRARLRSAGYVRDGQLWRVRQGPAGVSDILANVALDPRRRLVVMSDQPDQVRRVLEVVNGRARSLAGVQSASDTAEALAGSDSVILQAGTLGCDSAAVGEGDEQQQARAALDGTGELAAYRFSGRGLVERGGSGFTAQRFVLAMTFDDAAIASRQAQVRERLTAGPFIGRRGQVEDTLRLRSASSSGPTVRLGFAHDPRTGVFMTGTGTILFAAC